MGAEKPGSCSDEHLGGLVWSMKLIGVLGRERQWLSGSSGWKSRK